MTHPNDDESLDSSIESTQGKDESDQVSIPGEADRRPNRVVGGIRSSLESRRSSRVVDVVLLAFERNRRIPSSLFAGALASRILIFAIPFILVIAVTTGLYADVSDGDVAEIAPLTP